MPVMYDVITYTRPDAEVINLSDPPYMLVGHDGFGIGDMSQTWVSPPGLHGSYWYDTRMDAKIVSVEFEVHEAGVIERQNSRRDIVRLFNPLLGPGVLRIDQVNGVSRQMTCILAESASLNTDDYLGSGAAHYVVRFKSHGIPGVRDIDPTTLPVDPGAAGNFTFPWAFPFSLSQSGFFNRIVCTNSGDLPTNVHITMFGPLTNPAFLNETTGERISLQGLAMAPGQQLDIDTDPNELVVQINGADAWQYVYDAAFWQLAPGANSVLFDIGGTDPLVTHGSISWYNYVLGQ